jgi:hypothetical protein
VRTAPTLILCLTLASITVVHAEEAKKEPGKEAKWYDKLTFGGDLRLRYEGFEWPDHFDDGRRDRYRYRLRFGFEAQVLDDLALGVQLRSGNPRNPISDNQSFDDSFSKGSISIAEAYADWKVTDSFTLLLGKFAPEKLWIVSDLEWDDDVTTEGAMQVFRWKRGGLVEGLELNLFQFILDESGDSTDSYLFGGQVAPVLALGERNDLTIGAGFEAITHPEAVAVLYYTKKVDIDSGYVTNLYDPATGGLVSDFHVGSFFFEWSSKAIEGWPLKVNAFFYKNFGAGDAIGLLVPVGPDQDPTAAARGIDNDTGWFGRIQVGDYKKPGQVAVRFSRYDAKPDAFFFAYAQSDTRRSSNVDGYRTDLRIGMPKKGYVNVTWYNTNWTVGEDTTMNRWQFDYVFRF